MSKIENRIKQAYLHKNPVPTLFSCKPELVSPTESLQAFTKTLVFDNRRRLP